MANKIMKTLTIGESSYEVVDEAARNDIEELKQWTSNLDTTLTQSGCPADAKSTGDAINKVSNDLADINTEMSSAAATAQNTADSAVTAAANAQSTANSAVTAAQTAQNTADTALAQSGVTKVNNKTGAVTLSASDVGAAAESHTQASTTITTGGTDGQICTVNANGTISPNNCNVTDIVTKDMLQFKLELVDGVQTLKITTTLENK